MPGRSKCLGDHEGEGGGERRGHGRLGSVTIFVIYMIFAHFLVRSLATLPACHSAPLGASGEGLPGGEAGVGVCRVGLRG